LRDDGAKVLKSPAVAHPKTASGWATDGGSLARIKHETLERDRGDGRATGVTERRGGSAGGSARGDGIRCPRKCDVLYRLTQEPYKPGQEDLLVERHSEVLADAIAGVVEDEDLRVHLGRQGRKWVETTMDVERSLDRYAALYHELADRSRRGRPSAQ
jgi:hypothetical protein